MKVARAHRRQSIDQLLKTPPKPKPSKLEQAVDQRFKATIDRVRAESQKAALDFIGGEPTDTARPLGKAGSIKVKEAAEAVTA